MISFREIVIEDAKTILDWRTSKPVARFMNSEVIYDLEKQRTWISKSFNKSDYYHWIIQSGGKDIGLLDFTDWDVEQKTTSWGFYIGDQDALGFGGFVPPYFYNFAFDRLGVETVLAEVFYNNTQVIDLHLAQGYVFAPAKDHVIRKNGKDVLVVGMALERDTFKNSRFSRLKCELPIDHWKGCPL